MADGHPLFASERGLVEAPAGCGKTQLIAEAVGAGSRPQLVLTHTHSGVQALRRRVKTLGVAPRGGAIETITAFALRYARAYPGISGIEHSDPTTSDQFAMIFPAATRVFRSRVGREVLQATYAGLIVDEYQDCTQAQHEAVLALADVLPCRVLGDPLQAIFDFETDPVDWSRHVLSSFETIPYNPLGHRWKNAGALQLEVWLQEARTRLLSGQELDLSHPGVNWCKAPDDIFKAQRRACNQVGRSNECVIAIAPHRNASHYMARRLGGAFVSLEPIEALDVRQLAQTLDETVGRDRAAALLAFAASCVTKVGTETKGFANALARDDSFARVKKHVHLGSFLEAFANSSDPAAGILALQELQKLGRVYRRDRYDIMHRALCAVQRSACPTIAEGVLRVRFMDSRLGRREYQRVVSYTLLVKGLEFDRAIVLDPSSMTREHLYVALTRGARSLTVVSRDRFVQPAVRKPRARR